jgi:hypothetical protein
MVQFSHKINGKEDRKMVVEGETLNWRRSSRCGSTTCVEAAKDGMGVAVRDSKDRGDGAAMLWFQRPHFDALVAAAIELDTDTPDAAHEFTVKSEDGTRAAVLRPLGRLVIDEVHGAEDRFMLADVDLEQEPPVETPLVFTRPEINAFVAGARAGEFNF